MMNKIDLEFGIKLFFSCLLIYLFFYLNTQIKHNILTLILFAILARYMPYGLKLDIRMKDE